MKTANIITAAYNCPNWIFDYLYGWQNQQPVEGWKINLMIGVDGCKSTHQSLTKAKVPHYWSPINVGWPIITNSLHQQDQADVYIRFDADDVPLPEYFSVVINNLKNSQCFQLFEYRTDEMLNPIKKQNKSNTMVYTRAVLEKIGGFHPVRVGADKDFIGRARSAGFLGNRPDGHYFYKRQHKNALTKSKDTNMKSAFRKLCHDQMKQHVGYYVESKTVPLEFFKGKQ
jgi:hypothetical protein